MHKLRDLFISSSQFYIYLSRNFLSLWFTVVFGFLVIIGLLDSLANGGDIMANGESFTATFRYMFYRAPVIFDRIFMFTLVVAILLTFVKLIRQHELVALLSFGISVPKQIFLLTPVVLLASMTSIIVINTAMPPAVRALQAWSIGEYKTKKITDENPLWLEDSHQIVRAARRSNMYMLGDLEFFQRGEKGEILSVMWAETATYNGNGWELAGVQKLNVNGAAGEPRLAFRESSAQAWDTRQTPDSIARLAAEPRDLALADMRHFKERGSSGSKPSFAYDFWHMHRLTRPLAALILLVCCVPIMQQTGRESSGDKALITGITMGFVFLIIDGAMATFAASGGIAPVWAVTLPLIIFGLGGAYICIRTESLSRSTVNISAPPAA